MPTQRQLQLAKEMRIRVKLLRDMDYPEKKIEKLIRKLDLPIGLHLNLLNTKKWVQLKN